MEKTSTLLNYRDRVPRFWAAVIAALAISAIGMREQFLVLLLEHTWAVIIVYGLSFVLAWGLIWYVGWQTRKLDRSHPWPDVFYDRMLRQLLRGVGVPAAIILAFALIFFNFLTDPAALQDTGYFYSDYPLAVFMLIVLNMCYGFAYMAAYVKQLRAELASLRIELVNERELTKTEAAAEEEVKPNTYSLTSEMGEHAIPYEEIAYFKMCTVETVEGKMLRFIELTCMDGSKFNAKEDSLAQIFELTNGFFKQVCRRYMAAQHAITSCTQHPGSGKLTLILLPDAVEVELSIRNSSELKDWILEQVKTISRRGVTDAEYDT